MGLMDLIIGDDYEPRTLDEQEAIGAQAYQYRDLPENQGQDAQNLAAMGEHQAFARDTANRFGIPGFASMMLFSPAYEAAKLAGLKSGRSDPSWASMGAGFQGGFQGLMDYMN